MSPVLVSIQALVVAESTVLNVKVPANLFGSEASCVSLNGESNGQEKDKNMELTWKLVFFLHCF